MDSILEEIKALEGFGYGSASLDLEATAQAYHDVALKINPSLSAL